MPAPGTIVSMDPRMDQLLLDQAGVVSRRQTIARGLAPHDVARRLRRNEWAAVHPGVYVNHTGPLTWLQRAWSGVLFSWPAALSHESALRAAEGPGKRRDDALIHVAVGVNRSLVAPEGVRIHRMRGLDDRVLWNLGPPRVRYEDAAVDVATEVATDFQALGLLAEACQSRRTTALRIAQSITARPRVARRDWMISVLRDVADGSCSVLEHGYLIKVERAHGLCRPKRQAPATSSDGTIYRDVEYAGGLVVELDGRLFHDSAAHRDRDFDRDLDAAVDGRNTVRLSWGQVFDRPCWTAGRISRLLQARGWRGAPRPCGPECRLRV
ncbi:MAG: hypothetical protein JWR35_858 [Marmoricola sp.]|jgi:hypothetical protein|nr:hypothetical protein [Marmoricola sp.]